MREIIIYGVMALIAAFWIMITPLQIQEFEPEFGLTPRTFPLLILWGILILAIIGLVTSIFKWLKQKSMNKQEVTAEERDHEEEEMNMKKIAGFILLIGFLIFLIPYIGFYLAGGILLFIAFFIAGRKMWKRNMLYTVITMITIWLVFEKVMLVYLPKGNLFI
jgi:magnesium-transporting ATPase (P-type)